MISLQEELAEGLHLIDFEQLKIENQTYNEKIEERNEVKWSHCIGSETDASHHLMVCLLLPPFADDLCSVFLVGCDGTLCARPSPLMLRGGPSR